MKYCLCKGSGSSFNYEDIVAIILKKIDIEKLCRRIRGIPSLISQFLHSENSCETFYNRKNGSALYHACSKVERCKNLISWPTWFESHSIY